MLQPTYRVRRGRPVVQLYGRADGDGDRPGAPFLVEDTRYRPYFFASLEAVDRVGGSAELEIRESPLRTLRGAPVAQVVVPVPGAVPALRDRLGTEHAFEADIRFPYRYLIDAGIRSGLRVEGEAVRRGVLWVFENPELAPAVAAPRLTRLSIDLETTPDASAILSAALCGDGVDEVHLVGDAPVSDTITHANEAALLRALVERFAELDPDLILGWNVVDFDLRVLARRAAACSVALELGREPGELRFQEERGLQGRWRAQLPGRVVLDVLPLVREALRLEDYRLETVARAVVGRGKLLDPEVPDKAAEILRLYREDPAALAAYNREDARLVLEILEREGLLELCIERSLLTGMPLDRVSSSIASFDRLYLPALRARGRVAPSVDTSRGRRASELRGGALLEPVPGFHRNVAVFDFKSLYPSLMRTFQLDPLAHALAQEARGETIEAPNGAHFARVGAILPELLAELHGARERAKARGDRHADQAIKIMMNALYGVLGASACRFFDPEIANAITSFGQQTLHWAQEAFEAEGRRVLYGDTDSVFVALGDRAEAEALRERVELAIGARIEERYRVASVLALEQDAFYERILLPRVRGGRGGSKKRYAGWSAGKLRTVGLEAVRRDWPDVARRLQRGMLERIFTDRDPLPFVTEIVDAVRSGTRDEELVYRKRIRKASLDRYAANAPHVQAARKLGARAGSVVRYVITPGGPEPLWPGQAPPPGIDRTHYVERVLRPVADAILCELGQSFDAVLGKPTQLDLL